MLSGIGDPEELSSSNLAVRSRSKGSARSKPPCRCWWCLPAGAGVSRNAPHGRLLVECAKTYLFGTGFANDPPVGLMGFIKSSPDVALPDLQMMAAAPLTAKPYWPSAAVFRTAGAAASWRCVGKPRFGCGSRPPIRPDRCVFTRTFSRPRMIEGATRRVRIFREIAHQTSFDQFRGPEILPGAAKTSDADIDAFIRATR